MTIAVIHTLSSPCQCHTAILETLARAGIPAREVDGDGLPEAVDQLRGCRIAFDQTDSYRGNGQRYRVAEVLEEAGIAFVGSPSAVSRRLDDKVDARREFERVGLPVAPAGPGIGWPRVVKSAHLHCSRGVRLVRDPGEEARASEELPGPHLAEEYVPGRELAFGIVGRQSPRLLPAIEILLSTELYDYESKWTESRVEVVPARHVPPDVGPRLLEAYHRLGLRDFARFDLRVRPDGSWVVLEVNVRPGLRPHGLLAEASFLEGKSGSDLILGLLSEAGGAGPAEA